MRQGNICPRPSQKIVQVDWKIMISRDIVIEKINSEKNYINVLLYCVVLLFK